MDDQKQPIIKSKVVQWISQVLASVATVALLGMMIIGVIDVGGRYLFLKPLYGAFEMVGMSLVIAATLGMGYCELRNGHIRISLVTDRISGKAKAALNILAYTVAAAASGVMSWQGFLRMSDYMFKELGGTTEAVGMIIWPFMLVFFIGFGWICLILLMKIYKTVRGA